MMDKLDILAFAAHPDDAELSCSGTLIRHLEQGKKVGVIDLTRGELGTRGSAELRLKEAEQATKVLGLTVRENLGMADGFFRNDKEHQLQIVRKIRQYRPDIVLANAAKDRHPDHGKAGKLIAVACFLAGLHKIETIENGNTQEAWRPRAVYHYIQDRYIRPDIVVDISDYWDRKMQAILSYGSQFYNPGSQEPDSPISSPEFLEFVKARALDYGRLIQVKYGEGFTVDRPIGVTDLSPLL